MSGYCGQGKSSLCQIIIVKESICLELINVCYQCAIDDLVLEVRVYLALLPLIILSLCE